MTTTGSLDCMATVDHIQDINNEYLKKKDNKNNYDSIEVISEEINLTYQVNSAIKLKNSAMAKYMETIKKLLKKMTI